MAKATLPTNYQDDILKSSMNGKRRYTFTDNSDGTKSLEDATQYEKVGSNFGAADMNKTNAAVNAAADASKIIDNLSTIASTTQAGYMAGALAVKELNQNLQWKKIGDLTGTTTKNIDFSSYEEIYLVTRCAGNMTLVYTALIPVASLISTALQFCNGGYTSGVGAQCAWNVSLGSCQLVACYSGGTNYTGSNTIIYAR